jgi:6,7-dimethyl-8-ribityllumazine synthase
VGQTFQGELGGAGLRIAIAVGRFNETVTARLLEGARKALKQHEVNDDDVDVAWAAGAFELPVVAKTFAESGNYDAIVCLGAVIQGETRHFDFVAGEAARGITQVALETGVPVVFGVITPDNLEQALARAGGKVDKGYDAVVTAIETANLLRQIKAT